MVGAAEGVLDERGHHERVVLEAGDELVDLAVSIGHGEGDLEGGEHHQGEGEVGGEQPSRHAVTRSRRWSSGRPPRSGGGTRRLGRSRRSSDHRASVAATRCGRRGSWWVRTSWRPTPVRGSRRGCRSLRDRWRGARGGRTPCASSAMSSPPTVTRRVRVSSTTPSTSSRGASSRVASTGAAGDRTDPGDELAEAEGLHQVVVGAELETEDPVDLVPSGGEHDDRHRRVTADLAADLVAVDVGESEVEEHELDVVGPRQDLQRGVAGAHPRDDEALSFQTSAPAVRRWRHRPPRAVGPRGQAVTH